MRRDVIAEASGQAKDRALLSSKEKAWGSLTTVPDLGITCFQAKDGQYRR